MFSYSPNFWKLCLSMFFFTASFNLIIPELNEFLTNLNGAHLKGFVIALFTVSAGISRPFSGKLSDFIGRKKVMIAGGMVCFLVSLLYPLSHTIWFFLLLRFLHGFSAGFFPTGATALVTDILPEETRGRSMGIWGTFISLGIGFGQAFSSLSKDLLGTNGMFMAAGGLSILAMIFMANIQETLPKTERFQLQHLAIKKDEIIELNVIPVAVIMFLSAICSGIIFVLSPEMSDFLNISAKGWFFVWYVIATIGFRLFGGSISDRFGRRETLIVGMVILTASMLLIGMSESKTWFTLSSVLFGVATGICSPTIFAWTADLSPFHRRGIGAGTMFIALEFGIFAGSMLVNLLYNNRLNSVFGIFLIGAIAAFLCVVYLIWHLVRFPKTKKIPDDAGTI